MFHSTAKKLGAFAATTLIAATAIQGAVIAPAHAFSSSGMGTSVIREVAQPVAGAPYAEPVHISSDEAYVFGLINDYRAENGIGAISYDTGFANGAAQWAQYLVDQGRGPAHPTGTNFFENVAYVGSLDQAVAVWKTSPAHNDNLLDGRITHAGIGIAQQSNGAYMVVFRGLWEPANAVNSKGAPSW